MRIEIPMKINSEKKHSVRYDAVSNEAALISVYVMKSSLPKPIPQTITITINLENK